MKRIMRRCAVLLFCCLLLVSTAAAFSDVTPNIWYEDTVNQMAQAGIIHGYTDGTFRPDQAITTAEFVTIAVRCSGLSPAQESAYWAADNLQAALQAGWYDWDEIPPTGEQFNQPITRQLAVKILMKALLPDIKGDYSTESAKINDFSDIDGRYYDTVLAAYACGVVKGNDTGNFLPKSNLTRAEACTLYQRALALAGDPSVQPGEEQPSETPAPDVPEPVTTVQGGVTENGWLQVVGTQLCNEDGEAVVLRGMSTHGMQWYGQFASAQAIQNTASYGANVFRVAMYTWENGYLSQPDTIKQQVIAAVDAAIAQDMYVIIDWHILSDGNPMDHVNESAAFFTEMAQRYKDSPAVLYEICNEPNGNVSWAGDVKPYAEQVVAAIRAQSPNSVILIGSPTWSQDIHLAAADPVAGKNLMYTLHFYAGTHGEELRNRIDSALAAGLPVFISEWGTSAADGNGGVFLNASGTWLDFLAARGVSWCNWSLCDKSETSAALRPGTLPTGKWTESDLTESGQFVFSRFSQ